MTMTDPPTHSADEAGGEAIFTSDGLPALIVPLPPPPLNSDGRHHRRCRHHDDGNDIDRGGDGDDDVDDGGDDDDDDDALIIQEELDPRTAFQAFSRHPPTNAGWILNRPDSDSTANNVDGEAEQAGLIGGGGDDNNYEMHWVGDPRRRRLQYLKAEIDKLETTLNNNSTDNNNADDDDDKNNLKAMMIELNSRIDSLGMTHASSSQKYQEYLSRIIEKLSSDSLGFGGKDDLKMKLLHELHREQQQEQSSTVATMISSSSTPSQREALLEDRLRRLEHVMGSTSTTTSTIGSNNSNTHKSILERIEDAERLSAQMDMNHLEKLAAKAKVIRADFEAAARAKTKLGSATATFSKSSSVTNTTAELDSQVISALHAQLIELDGISTSLPALTHRLLELSNLHTNAAEFSSRLSNAEMAIGRSERMLSSVEEALTKMELGWKENRDVLERNVKRLDDMMLSLLGDEKKK